MSFDGFFIFHLVSELNHKLAFARLEKIVAVDVHRFLLSFYRRGEKHKLLLSTDAHQYGTYLTEKSYEPIENTQFVMQLKKHIEGAILESITQYKTDRVIIFNFKSNDFIDGPTTKSLVFEAMGKHSNVILVQDDKIIDCHKKMFFEDGRQLLPQADFSFFPSDKKPFHDLSKSEMTDAKQLVETTMGISPFFARYLVLEQPDIDHLIIKPTFDHTAHQFYAIDLFPLNHDKTYYDTLSLLLDHYAPKKTKTKQPQLTFIESQLKKYHKKASMIDQLILDAKKNLGFKEKGDLIYQSGLSLKERHSSIVVGDIEIITDPTKTLNENAQRFYAKYQKAKRSFEHLDQQQKENDALIETFNDFKTYLELSLDGGLRDLDEDLEAFGYKTQKKQKAKKPTKPNILTLNLNGITYYVGKNSKQNQYITQTLGQKDDFWFHVKDAPGSHVLVKAKALDESIIRTAALLAAYFSKLRQSSSIPVDYTQVKHLKKIPKHPTYQVLIQSYKTIFIDIDIEKINRLLSP
ncbi:MAG: Rqc2 family fibronectin-binding protein [Acholeplasmataceae bacterium]